MRQPMLKRMLITGGAGFVGSSLALRFAEDYPSAEIVAFDNLKRRGSELSLERFRGRGVGFVHGDVRIREDLLSVGEVDLIVDCAAEPSVLAGVGGSPDYVIQTNLGGTLHCLELARRYNAGIVFLSTSRVYPFETINALDYDELDARYMPSEVQSVPGASARGISEAFPLDGARSAYGASKLASELILQEYAAAYGIRSIVNRCGVLTGPWQMGKTDQGVVVLWAARHAYGGALAYIGYGGSGKQVRDILHVDDLYELLTIQLADFDGMCGEVFNVGGGPECSVSLLELTGLCQAATGNEIPIAASKETRPNDILCYLSDTTKVTERTGWRPRHSPADIIEEITHWLADNRTALERVLA